MNKHRVVSLAIVIALIAMMIAPGVAFAASASVSVSAPSTAAPGETISVTIRVTLDGSFKGVGTNSVSLGDLEYVSASLSGFDNKGGDAHSTGFAVYTTVSTGGICTFTVRIPSNASNGDTFTFSSGGVDAVTSDDEVISRSDSTTITVAGDGGTTPTGGATPAPTPAPTATADPSGYGFAISASASTSNVKPGDNIKITINIAVTQGAFRGFGMKFDGGGMTVGKPTASGLSPLTLGATETAFSATGTSSTTGSGTVTVPVYIPSTAKNGTTYTFTISGIEGVTDAGTAQIKNNLTVKVTVGSGSGSGSGSGGSTATPDPIITTPVPVKAPAIRTSMVGAMSGFEAGETIAYQLKYQVIEGEAAGFSAMLSFDSNVMEPTSISFVMPEEWSGSSDGSSFTVMKTGYGETLKPGGEVLVNIKFKLKASTSNAMLLTLTNMLVSDTQWNQHSLNEVSAIANANTPSFTAAITALEEAEPGAYVDVAVDFTPMNGAFHGFLATMDFDPLKLSYISAEVPKGWTLIAQGNQVGMASEGNMVFTNETVRLTLRFFISSSAVVRGDTIPLTLKSIIGQAIGDVQSLDKYQFTTQDAMLNLAISTAIPSFTAKLYPQERRTLPGSSVKYTLELTSAVGHLAGFSMDYTLGEGLTLVNGINDLGWSMTYEGNKLKLYTNGVNAIKKGTTIKVDFYMNVSAAAQYGSSVSLETGTITGVSHLAEQMTHDGVKGSVLIQAAFINQKLSKYDFTSSISAGVNGANELVVAERNYGALLTDASGISAGYNVCIANIGNKDNVLAIDALSDNGTFGYRQISLTYDQLSKLNSAGVDFFALVVDGGMVMVNLNTIMSKSGKATLKNANCDVDKARLVLSIAPVNDTTASIGEMQVLRAQNAVTDAYRANAYIAEGSLRLDASEISGFAFVVFSMEDEYLTGTIEKSSSLRVLGIDTTLLAEQREARLLSDLVDNSRVRRAVVGTYKAEGIYAVSHK